MNELEIGIERERVSQCVSAGASKEKLRYLSALTLGHLFIHCQRAKPIYIRTSQKVVDGFGLNLVDTLGV